MSLTGNAHCESQIFMIVIQFNQFNAHCESQIFMIVIQFNPFNAILQFIITLTTSWRVLLLTKATFSHFWHVMFGP